MSGPRFCPDLLGDLAAWAQGQPRSSTAEGLGGVSSASLLCAVGSSAGQPGLGLPPPLQAAGALVVGPSLSWAAAVLCLCSADPDPDSLA